ERLPGVLLFLFAVRVFLVAIHAQIGVRRDGDAVRVGRTGPEDFVVHGADGNLRARDGRGGVEARHEDERVPRRLVAGDAGVRDLHDRAGDVLGGALRFT